MLSFCYDSHEVFLPLWAYTTTHDVAYHILKLESEARKDTTLDYATIDV